MPLHHLTSILDSIGNTPLVSIRRIPRVRGVTILAKMESFNPGGSIKDRIALSMVESAERRGDLTKDRIILEASSGNTGIGLALVSAVKGYRCLIAMSEGASMERRQIMTAYGAEILLTPADKGTDGAIEAVYRLAREQPDRYYCTDQFNNPDNWMAHYSGTAREIWDQTGGKVTSVICTMGTTGTLMGITRRMREFDPAVRVVGVEPFLGHRIQGLKNMKESYRPGIFEKRLPDAIVNVEDEEAFEMTRRLAREEGLFVGMSSGAAMVAALQEASLLEKGLIVVIFPDGGDRYLSTGVFPGGGRTKKRSEKGPVFTNTLSRRIEPFEPLNPGIARIYSCGPTAYEYAHLGLCRRVVFADLLRRVLEADGFEVTHVMNITDIDDKTVKASISRGEDLKTFTGRFIEAFHDDMAHLGVKPASRYPLASDHLDEMIAITKRLIEAGFAYVRHGSVYFDISKLPSYGRLSRVDLSSIDVGRTEDLDDYEKDSPVDFTLLKRVELDELKRGIGFESPWGQVRPGWHIECVAMSMKYLGDFFDIHTSGSDLVFPHHENEIAIASALTGKTLSKAWLHSEPVFVNGKKMSLAAGNAVTLRDLLSMGYTGREVRFFILRTNYRKPLPFSVGLLDAARVSLARIDAAITRLSEAEARGNPFGDADLQKRFEGFHARFMQSLNHDLNVSGALGAIYGLVRALNPLLDAGRLGREDARAALDIFAKMDAMLGVFALDRPRDHLPDEVRTLAGEREEARRSGDYESADRIRERIAGLGYLLMDTRFGVKIIPRNGTAR